LNFIIENFDEYAVRIEKATTAIRKTRYAMPSVELWSSEFFLDIAEMQNRLTVPMGVIFLSFLAVPLAKLSPRGGVYGSLLIAFAIYFVYGNLKRIAHSWVVKEVMPLWSGFFWVYGLLFLLGCAMLIRLYGFKWLMMKVYPRGGM
jgi:lipopolysaccharide export system permease protein